MPVTISVCKTARIRIPPSTRRKLAAPLPGETTEVDGGVPAPDGGVPAPDGSDL
ncbi:MAG: hypothetical protein ACXVFK_09205 [Solirubrobacteraceae bacterium]